MLHIALTAKRNGIFHAVSFCVRPAAFVLLFYPASSGRISICSSRKYLQQNLIFFSIVRNTYPHCQTFS